MANSGSFWTSEEDEQLKKLYTKYNMDILEIAKIHKRSNGAIRSRLIKHKLIKDDNFIKTELVNLEKNKIPNGIVLLSGIISKHFNEINQRIDNLELKIKGLIDKNELNGLD